MFTRVLRFSFLRFERRPPGTVVLCLVCTVLCQPVILRIPARSILCDPSLLLQEMSDAAAGAAARSAPCVVCVKRLNVEWDGRLESLRL